MRRSCAVAVMLLAGGLAAGVPAGAQAAGGQTAAAPAASGPAATAPKTAGGSGANAAAPDTRTEKQKTLARQTERLFDMATELKVQVDKTNKNILSLKVVEKAEEIEALAKGMKEQAKR